MLGKRVEHAAAGASRRRRSWWVTEATRAATWLVVQLITAAADSSEAPVAADRMGGQNPTNGTPAQRLPEDGFGRGMNVSGSHWLACERI